MRWTFLILNVIHVYVNLRVYISAQENNKKTLPQAIQMYVCITQNVYLR